MVTTGGSWSFRAPEASPSGDAIGTYERSKQRPSTWDGGWVQTPNQCSICGGAAHLCPAPRTIERLHAWFAHGERGRGEHYECENGHGWASLTYQYPGTRSFRLSGMWKTMASNRTIAPTPQGYTIVAGIGLLAGVPWMLLFGWKWWLGPISFVVALWMAALVTAFRVPQRARIIETLHDQLRPLGAADRRRQRVRHRISQASFAPVGLIGSPDSPWLGGISSTGGRVTSITIVYGDPGIEAAPFLEVIATVDDGPGESVRDTEEYQLRHMPAEPLDLPSREPSLLAAQIEWIPAEASVDGATRAAGKAVVGDHWSLVIEDLPDLTVVVRGHHGAMLDPTALETITTESVEVPQ